MRFTSKKSVILHRVWMHMVAIVCVVAGITLSGCSDNTDESNLYVMHGQTIYGILSENQDFSIYTSLLNRVKLSQRTKSTVAQLLQARGHYVVFAASNEAIQQYIDSIYNAKNYDYTQIDDSVASLLVLSSIIDCGDDDDAFTVSSLGEGAIERTNLADRYITVAFEQHDGKAMVKLNREALVTTQDLEAVNGYVNVVDHPLVLSNAYLPQVIDEASNLKIFSMALKATGWDKKLVKYRDEDYEKEDHNNGRDMYGNKVDQPEHRYFGYTAFVEPDSIFHEKWGIDMPIVEGGVVTNQATIMQQLEAKCREAYPFATNTSLTDSNNCVNQFIAYHLLPERITYDKLVIHYAEIGYSYLNPSRLTIDCFEYYETMTEAHRRVLKLTEGKQTDGIRINRCCTYDEDTYDELTVTRPGIRVYSTNGQESSNALNGFYYPIDDILVYDDDVPGRVLNERMRYDISSLLPELMTNGYRRVNRNISTQMPTGYFDNLTFSKESHYNYLSGYNCGWPDFQGDEQNITGQYDLTLRLPPVPYEGTYELRWAIPIYPTRGMAQFYFGTNKQNLTAIGLPIDLRLYADNPTIGWQQDTDDPATNREHDRVMRNHGYMMPPRHDAVSTGGAATSSLRAQTAYQRIRKIIYTGPMKPDQVYYVRCKSVLANTSTQFVMDWLELVPRNVYSGDTPEDQW